MVSHFLPRRNLGRYARGQAYLRLLGRVSQGVQWNSQICLQMPTKIETSVGDWQIWETTLLKKGNSTISKLTTASERMAHESPQKVSQQFIWWLSKHPWRSFCKKDQERINRLHVKENPRTQKYQTVRISCYNLQIGNSLRANGSRISAKSISAVYLMVVKASLAQFLQNRPGCNQQMTCEKKTQWQRNIKR